MNWQILIEQQAGLAHIPAELRKQADCRSLDRSATLFHIGDLVQTVFSVISGEVRLVRRDMSGSEIVLQRSRGGFFAEASLGSARYHCDAVATEVSKVLCFPARQFRAALDDDADFRDAWLGHLAREVRKLRAQCERLNLRRADERIAHFIESEGTDGSITLNQPRKAWAAELGLTHEALYRALSQLQRNGRLSIQGQQLSLKKPS
ncbi:MAG: Crp/Fnr family transcriptional regulator [Rhodocyclaceae bacterium]